MWRRFALALLIVALLPAKSAFASQAPWIPPAANVAAVLTTQELKGLRVGDEQYPTYSLKSSSGSAKNAADLLTFNELVVPLFEGARAAGFVTLTWSDGNWHYSGRSPDNALVEMLRDAGPGSPFYDPGRKTWLRFHDGVVNPLPKDAAHSESLQAYAATLPQSGSSGTLWLVLSICAALALIAATVVNGRKSNWNR